MNRVLILLLLLLAFLGYGQAQEISLQEGIQIIQVLSDPAKYIEYFPDTDRWIPWFGQRVREYKVPVILYNMGLVLLVLGVAVLIYQVLLGRRGITDVLVKVLIALTAWQLLVLRPAQNGCTPETVNRYPCQLEVVTRTKPKPVLVTDGRSYTIDTRPVNVREPQAPEIPMHRAVKALFKDVMLAGANAAIIASLRNEGEGIKRAQQIILNLSMISWAAAGAASIANEVPALLRCGLGGLGGMINNGNLSGGLQGCAAGAGAVPEVARNVGSTMATARTLLVVGPMLVIATFHAVNTIAGLYLYSLLFFMPLLVPLVLIAGVQILGNAAKYGLIAIITPLVSGVLLSTGMSLSYSYSAGKLEELDEMATELERSGLPVGASGFAVTNNSLASLQLYNLYKCLEAEAQNEGAVIGRTRGDALCTQTVQSAVEEEFNAIVAESYQGRNIDGIASSGQTLRNVILGQAYRRTVEQATPTFVPGPLWTSRSADDRAVMLADLRKLFGSGQGTGLAGNTRAMLEFFKRHRGFPDYGFPVGRTINLMMTAEGMTAQQAGTIVNGFFGVTFNAADLPPGSLLEASDTWANGVSALGLMNRVHAAESSNSNFQNVMLSTLRSKMLNLVILTLTAVGITIVMLGIATQMLGAFFGAVIGASSSGLERLANSGSAAASAGSAFGHGSRSIPRVGGGNNTVVSPAPSSRTEPASTTRGPASRS